MNKLYINKNTITIKCDGSQEELMKINTLIAKAPVHSSRNKKTHIISTRYIQMVLKVYRGINLVDDIPEEQQMIRKLYTVDMEMKDKLRELTQADYTDQDNSLFIHQRMGLEISRSFDRFGFFYSVRSGKTPMSLAIINDNPETTWLIVCPLVLIKDAWIDDAKKFFPNIEIVNLWAKTKKQREAQYLKKSKVYIVNTEAFANNMDAILKLGITGVILDESSSLKSATSKFSKAFFKFSDTVAKCYLLSGTPASNGQHEYYGQLRAIDKYAIHQSYTKFKNDFFVNVSFNPQYEKLQLREDRRKDLDNILARHSIFVDATDWFKFPGRAFHDVPVDMPQGLKDQYKAMRKDLGITINDKEILAESEASLGNKLRQLASGFVYDEDKKAYELSKYRIEVLLGLLHNECRDEQVVIWMNYRYEADMIKKALGNDCVIVNGETTAVGKIEAIAKFKTGKVKYFVANQASADKGLTLTNACKCIYFSTGYSYELFAQSLARIYGGIHSQPRFCDYYFIKANNSMDNLIYKALEKKEDASTAVLDYLRVRGE